MQRPLVLLAVLVLLSAARAQPAASDTERIEARDGSVVQAELGRLEVPERRGAKGTRSLSLAWMRIRSESPEPGPPVFLLAGGPGGSAIEQLRRHASGGGAGWRGLMGGDIVALDQRGVGLSQPNLDSETSFGLPLDVPGEPEALLAAIRKVSQAEAARWRAQGVDLAGYTTSESVEDLEALRVQLGLGPVSLWAESYGTHLAVAFIRKYPASVARAVLVGPEGPDHTLKLPSQAQAGLERVAALVAADADLGPRIPDLVGLVARVLERLGRQPASVELDGRRVAISRFDAQWLFSNLLGSVHGGIDILPALVLALDQGDAEPCARLLAEFKGDFGVGTAMAWMIDASAGASKPRLARIAREAKTCLLGGWVDFPHPQVASAWGAVDAGSAFRAPPKADTPVLFITGDLDSRTPPSNAEELMAGLPNASLIVVENAAHDVNWMLPGLREAWPDFLAGRPVASARVTAPALRFAPLDG